MTYRAPVADIAFTLKHTAGFGGALEEGLYGDLTDDLVDAVLEEAGKFATDVIAPLNRRRRQARHAARGRHRHNAAGLEGRLPKLGRGRLERACVTGRMGRPGAAACGQRRLHRDVERGLAWPSASARC